MNAFLLGSYIALWLLVLIMAGALLALFNHFGTMYLSSRGGRATQGPALDSTLDPFEADALDSARVQVPSGRPALLVLASTDCPECGKLTAPLQSLAESRAGSLDVVVLCGGRRMDVADWARGLRAPLRVIADRNFRRASALGVGITPFVIGIDGGGVVRARGLLNGEEGLLMAADDVTRSDVAPVGADLRAIPLVGGPIR